jgi:DnaK suppressor protein
MIREETRDLLTTRRDQLQAELVRLTAPPTDAASVSFGKRIGDGTTEAVERLSTTVTARSIAASIAEIDHALGKLDAGSYGTCDDCGEAIPEVRLEVRPAASLCVDCASAAR